mgnify:CR=1 FL=1
MNVTLRQLRAFLALAKTGSFTVAAESLFITQSALSGLIKELEESLGLRLVDRSTRRVHLTGVGENLLPVLEKILHDLDSAIDRAVDLKSLKTGVVRVAASQLMASALFPELIAAYQAEHPGISIKLVDCGVESVMARVFAGEVDFGIGPEREPNSEITSTPLFAAPFVVVVPQGHALARHQQVRWADLANDAVIALQGQFTERLVMDLRAATSELQFKPVHQVAFMSTALAMVNARLGITVCIPYAASLVRLYGLEMRPLAQPEIRRSFDVLSRKGRSLTPAAQSFLDFIGPRIRALPFLE